MSCQCPTPSNLPEQAEFNCLPSHLGSFCPPECKKCNPCMGLNYCDCPQLPDCEGCKVDPYVSSYLSTLILIIFLIFFSVQVIRESNMFNHAIYKFPNLAPHHVI